MFKFKKEEGSLIVQLKDIPLGNYWLQFDYFSGEVTKTKVDEEPTPVILSIYSQQTVSVVTRIDFVQAEYELSTESSPSQFLPQ